MTLPLRMTRAAPMTTSIPVRRATRPMLTATTFASARPYRVSVTRQSDTVLLLTVLALVMLGILMVQSASQFYDPVDPGALARREALWAALGGVALFVTARIDYHRWRVLAWPAMVVALLLLALVVIFGVEVGGAQRWLAIGDVITFQPSEVAKLAFTLFIATQLTQGDRRDWSWRRLIPIAGTSLGCIGVVLLQNDLGTAIILAACALALLLLAGMPARSWLALAATLVTVGITVIAATPFRRGRILAFLHPLQCGDANSYHICQSLIALGSGGVMGRGLGDGLQKAGYLPAPYTDSIFAVIGEELGLWGTLLVVSLCALLLWRGLRIARHAPDAFGALLAGGIVCWLGVQAILNIGSSVAALPFTGVPLPFISFGGSSLIVSLAAVGVLLNISTHQPARRG